MAIGLSNNLPVMHAVAGVRLASAAAGIRYQGRDDILLIEISESTHCAAVFTRNLFCAAPVLLAKQHLAEQSLLGTSPRYLLINSGNANAGTGEPGMQVAMSTCVLVAELSDCQPSQVLPFSTGVIGELLPITPFENSMPALLASLDESGWEQAARTIMTTDTVPKGLSRKISLGGGVVTITAMAKGSGMIRPDMATMLAYIATDALIAPGLLQKSLDQAVAVSFNSITVDGDTSTNDACVLMATGASAVVVDQESDDLAVFNAVLCELCSELAQMIIRDAEGVTKFITIKVSGGESVEDCREIAYTVAHSPLVKTAFFASDPNWGRILAAIGRAKVNALDIDVVAVFLDDVCIVRNGARAESYTEQAGQAVMDQEEITIGIVLGEGDASATIWTSDLSYDYVKINAEYRT